MIEALRKLLGKKESSGDVARRRLQLVIINDRANVSPEIMDSMRAEIVQVISKYMYIDTREMEFSLENENDAMALVVNIPGDCRHESRHHRQCDPCQYAE